MEAKIVALVVRIIGKRTEGFIGVDFKSGEKSSELSLTFTDGVYSYSVPRRHLKSKTAFSIAKGLFLNVENDRIVKMLPVISIILARLKSCAV
jgi:hypothetical protein